MGGCTASKHVDTEVETKKSKKKPVENVKASPKKEVTKKKEKKEKKEDNKKEVKKEAVKVEEKKTTAPPSKQATPQTSPKAEPKKKDESKKEEDDDEKKEVTTFQTTIVKHSQFEGDELLQHLKEEAFRTFQQCLLKQKESGGSSEKTDEDIVDQVKKQCISAIGNAHQDHIYAMVDESASLVSKGQVKNMNELQVELEKKFGEKLRADASTNDLAERLVKAITGYLTAKGTEAATLLSNLLAQQTQAGQGTLHGVMNETEKTTVKVTRTVTEHIMTPNGQIKEVTRVLTGDPSQMPTEPPADIQELLKQLSAGGFVTSTTSGSTTTAATSFASEKRQQQQPPTTVTVQDDGNTILTTTTQVLASSPPQITSTIVRKPVSLVDEKEVASQVVSNAVQAAVERLQHDEEQQQLLNGHHAIAEKLINDSNNTETHIEHEVENTVTTSTTKFIVENNGGGSVVLEKATQDFYKNGKHEAEDAVKKMSNSIEVAAGGN